MAKEVDPQKAALLLLLALHLQMDPDVKTKTDCVRFIERLATTGEAS